MPGRAFLKIGELGRDAVKHRRQLGSCHARNLALYQHSHSLLLLFLDRDRRGLDGRQLRLGPAGCTACGWNVRGGVLLRDLQP